MVARIAAAGTVAVHTVVAVVAHTAAAHIVGRADYRALPFGRFARSLFPPADHYRDRLVACSWNQYSHRSRHIALNWDIDPGSDLDPGPDSSCLRPSLF